MGSEDNILQLTFALEKHEWLLRYLKNLDGKVRIRAVEQKKFRFNSLFTEYFSGRLTRFPVTMNSPLLGAGTDFQKRAWQCIGAIPYGTTITYRELAEAVGSPKGSRAAGAACGANPVALLIPCHRVVAVRGLGGFAGGVSIKQALLAMEQSHRKPAE